MTREEAKTWCPVCVVELGDKREKNPYAWKLCAAHDRLPRTPRKKKASRDQ